MKKISIIFVAVLVALLAFVSCDQSVGDLFGFELSFSANGGTGTMANVSVKGSSTTAPANQFTRDGYTFTGWNTQPDGSGTEYKVGDVIDGYDTLSIRLFAQWSLNTYSINVASAERGFVFIPVNAYTVKDEDVLIPLTAVPYLGYIRDKYQIDNGARYDSFAESLVIPAGTTGDITITPSFLPIGYFVDYEANAPDATGFMEPDVLEYDKDQELAENEYSREGYVFAGWNTEKDGTGKSYEDKEEVKNLTYEAFETVVLYAQWEVAPYTISVADGIEHGYAEVTFDKYSVGNKDILIPVTPVPYPGYSLSDITVDNAGAKIDPYTGDLVIYAGTTGDITITPVFTANEYRIKFDANCTDATGFMDYQVFKYDEAQQLEENAFARTGYTFAGWNSKADGRGLAFYDKMEVMSLTTAEYATLTLYAQWNPTQYEIKFADAEHGSVSGLFSLYTVDPGASFLPLYAEAEAGYELTDYVVEPEGVYVENGYLIIPEGTASEIIVKPVFDKVEYSITFNLSERGFAFADTTSYTIIDPEGEPVAVELTALPDAGFALFDWHVEAPIGVVIEDNILTIFPGAFGDITVTPEFLPVFNVTLVKDGGTVEEGYDITTYFVGEGATLPAAEHFTRTGNVFGGWFDNDLFSGDPVTEISTTSMGDKTFYAKWTPNKYKVAFDKNATAATGTMADQNFTYDVAQNLTAVGYSRTGYTFAGWNTVATPTEQEPGTSYADKASVSNLTEVDGATVTLYAQWTANTYKVVFNANGGSGTMADQSFTYDVTQALTENAFTRTGHTFANWNSVATPTQQTPGVSYADKAEVSNLTDVKDGVYNLYAQWTANVYTVTLNTNGGTIAEGKNVTKYTYGTGATLPAVTETVAEITKEGYTFGGWYDNEQCTGTAVTTISTTDLGNKTFYAKWTAVTYTVKFDKNSDAATGAMTDMTFTYDVTQALTANSFKRIGHSFAGWNTLATPTEQEPGRAFANKEEVKNLKSTQDAEVTLYAQWELTEYSVKITSGSEGYTVTPSADKYYYTPDQSGTVITLDIEGPIPTIDHYSNLSPATANVDVGSANNTVTIKSGSYGDIEITCYFITDYKTVTFKANGGTGDDVTQYVGTDIETALKANTFTRDTMYFAGWSTTAEGEVEYEDGAMITVTEDTTLYAVWTDEAPFEYITNETTTLTGGKTYTIADDHVSVMERVSIDGTDAVTIVLPEGKEVSFYYGITVNNGQALNIEGDGDLTAFALISHAGIGGSESDPSCGTINISGGTIQVWGGDLAAGIGGAYGGNGGNVIISGGTVIVYGGFGAAGIGGGAVGNGGSFTITGGTLQAKGCYDEGGINSTPAIGHGCNRSSDGTIEVGPGIELFVSDDGESYSPYDGGRKLYMAVFAPNAQQM